MGPTALLISIDVLGNVLQRQSESSRKDEGLRQYPTVQLGGSYLQVNAMIMEVAKSSSVQSQVSRRQALVYNTLRTAWPVPSQHPCHLSSEAMSSLQTYHDLQQCLGHAVETIPGIGSCAVMPLWPTGVAAQLCTRGNGLAPRPASGSAVPIGAA